VYGENSTGSRIGDRPGVYGKGNAEDGVWAISTNGNGLFAQGRNFGAYVTGTMHGLYADSASGQAGWFGGNVLVTGNLSKSGGSFKIDHPLDPANKYLSHSFVESPDMKNIYDGVTTLDASGAAWVELPEWFGALNSSFRYQLTSIGAPGPNLYIAQEISGNQFKIAGGEAGGKVSWQVTGIRQDAWANAHRIQVEEAKPEAERGHYLHPELYNQPETKSIQWALHPELMQRSLEEKERSKAKQQ